MSKSKPKAPPSAYLGVNAAATLTAIYYEANRITIRDKRVRLNQPTIIGKDEIEATFLGFLRAVREIVAELKKEVDK